MQFFSMSSIYVHNPSPRLNLRFQTSTTNSFLILGAQTRFMSTMRVQSQNFLKNLSLWRTASVMGGRWRDRQIFLLLMISYNLKLSFIINNLRSAMSVRLFRFRVQVEQVLNFQAELPLHWSVFQLKYFVVKGLAEKGLKIQTWQLQLKQEGRNISNSQRLQRLGEELRVNRIASAQLKEISRTSIEERRKNIIEFVRGELAKSEKTSLWLPEIGLGNHFSQIKQPAEQAQPNQPRFLLNLIFLTFVFINKLTFKAVVVCALLFGIYMVFKLFNNQQQTPEPRPVPVQEPAEVVPQAQVQQPSTEQNVKDQQVTQNRNEQSPEQVAQAAQQNQIDHKSPKVRVMRVLIMIGQMVYCYFCSLFPNWNVNVHMNMHKGLIERLKRNYFPQLVPT